MFFPACGRFFAGAREIYGGVQARGAANLTHCSYASPFCGFSVLAVDISFGRCEYSGGFPVEFRLDFSTLGLSEPARVKRPAENPQGNSQGPWRPTCAGWVAPPAGLLYSQEFRP